MRNGDGVNDALGADTIDPTALMVPTISDETLRGETLMDEGMRRSRGRGARAVRRLPLIGNWPLRRQLQTLLPVLAVSLVLAFFFLWLDSRQSEDMTVQTQIVGDSLMHSQRLAKEMPYALAGTPEAFASLRESRDQLTRNFEALRSGAQLAGVRVESVQPELQPALQQLAELWQGTERAASGVLAQERLLVALGTLTRKVNASSPRMLAIAEQVAQLKAQSGGSREVAAAGQVGMLSQRLAKNINLLLTTPVVNPEIEQQLLSDTEQLRLLTEGLLSGNAQLRLAPASGELVEPLTELRALFNDIDVSMSSINASMQNLRAAKQGEQRVFSDSERLRAQLTEVQRGLAGLHRGMSANLWFVTGFGLLALFSALALARVYVDDSRSKAEDAEQQRHEAERLEQEAKRTNDQNQAAILRLMNELQEVADGDLTVHATVSEDITGAIADSVNYTIEELRSLVSRINSTAAQVNEASSKAQMISGSLLAASEHQSREIRETGEAVLKMAQQINVVSQSAAESAKVARQSLAAAEDGSHAVQNAISGMNDIREHIQETSKRIKRLGESSQEIGEIVELISDITEQTNVLALNAAIQAASAGEAGRGFTVVAEEVQRLAERSAEATKQIAALIRTIQTDTQDAVSAMELSTQGVVEGARLSDAAGQSLEGIGMVSRQLAELIENISSNTSRQAASAGTVAQSIQRILLVTEQTSEGTQQTAQSIRQLSELAQQLKSSVSRFKVT
ncbi:MAG: type IV pili methyl-accepting chemotaxis transducer N-terminal domain-containing protein [Burkholderiales bacterium]|nr:MAG: type IV pili methyl-accepting chemotaxis transducer N-terminal domain-containing protein [Burkholderiales bacterium]